MRVWRIGLVSLVAVVACTSSSTGGGGDAGAPSGGGSGGGSGSDSGGSGSSSSGSSSTGSSSSSGASSGAGSASSSGAGSSGSSGGDGGSSGGDGGPDATIDCSLASLTGAPAFTPVQHTQAYPGSAATGGTIVTGTYFETAEDFYSGGSATNATRRVVTFDATNLVFKLTDNASSDGGVSGGVATYTTAGSTLNLQFTCGLSGVQPFGYTLAGSQLLLYDSNNLRVDTFAKQ